MTKISMYTMCLVIDDEKVLLINRPNDKGFPGYLGPGGKVDFPESPTEGAIREVLEETGLKISNLIYKGLDEYVDEINDERYMVFNYITYTFIGQPLDNPPEGELKWVDISKALELPMQGWFKERFPLFFEKGTFEKHVVWDDYEKKAMKEVVTRH
ncbi:8-oxo-dGTP diphosphatase [Sutcliffiella horikoshii]|uniref:8-oxo-dGTP diphosphatase n=1 Tax=Sutcliffiella horikoshii TaxID=79883 RepID=UPI00203FE445|nr:8-oxo-dGTP diphosphatase [Sutcliffiella horikoshii]MCM3616104.1 8-oxo-dGTP diphosphatase [Sutcliffiella horikoshii]